MKLFSDCSGGCLVCACTGGCLAGHGDDDFQLASKEALETRLRTKRWGGKSDGRPLDEAELEKIRGLLETMEAKRVGLK